MIEKRLLNFFHQWAKNFQVQKSDEDSNNVSASLGNLSGRSNMTKRQEQLMTQTLSFKFNSSNNPRNYTRGQRQLVFFFPYTQLKYSHSADFKTIWKNSFPPKTGLPTEHHNTIIVSHHQSCRRNKPTVKLSAVSLVSALVMDTTTMYHNNPKTHRHLLFTPAFVKNT